MDPGRIALVVVLLPAVVAGIVLLVARRLGRPAVPVAVSAGFFAGFVAAAGVPRFPPAENWQWLLGIQAAALVVGVAEARRCPAWLKWIFVAGLLTFVAHAIDLRPPLVRTVGVAFGALLVYGAFRRIEERSDHRTLLGTVLTVATATAVSLLLSGTLTIAETAGILASATFGCVVVAGRGPVATAGVATIATALLVGLWLSGWRYAGLPAATAILLAASPFAAWTPVANAGARPLRAALVRVALVAVVAGAAVAIAVAQSPPLDY